MKKFPLFIAILLLNSSLLFSQVAINTDGSAPDASAGLDVCYTNKGFLPPRMTANQRTAISSPATGLLVFQTDVPSGYYFYGGTGWAFLGFGDGNSGNIIDIDGNGYRTVKIGNQEWMAENLRVTHYRNGDAIPNVTDNSSWESLTTGAYCWYGNNQSIYEDYGILYNWHTLSDSRELCPAGWHVPSDGEWTALTLYLGGESIAGGRMKVAVLWITPNTGATNSSGFSGLPGGYRFPDGNFASIGNYGVWWSSTEIYDYHAWERLLDHDNTEVDVGYYYMEGGLSVRCVRDI